MRNRDPASDRLPFPSFPPDYGTALIIEKHPIVVVFPTEPMFDQKSPMETIILMPPIF